jgi:hypothetical protein
MSGEPLTLAPDVQRSTPKGIAAGRFKRIVKGHTGTVAGPELPVTVNDETSRTV